MQPPAPAFFCALRTAARPWIRVGAAIGRPQSRPAITQRQCKYVPRFHVPYSHRPVLSCRFHRGRAMLAPTRCIAAGTYLAVGAAIGRPQSRPAIPRRQCKSVSRFHGTYSHRPVLSCRFHRGRAMLAPTRCIAAGTYLAVGAAIGRPQSRPAIPRRQCKSVPRFHDTYSHRPVLSCRFHRGRAMLAPTRWTAPYCSKSAAFRSAKCFLSDSLRRSGPLTS